MDNTTTRSVRKAYIPPVRVIEDENHVIVQLEMPGVSREGLEIKIDGNTLTIDGRREEATPSGKYLFRERRVGDFHKAFTVDDSIDREGIGADLADGILSLRLKVKEAAKPRRIAVN